jgi:hypothetical protein
MPDTTRSRFKARLLRPRQPGDGAPWAFVALPRAVSEKLPRRGRITVAGTVNGHGVQVTLEPDGQLSHWLRLEQDFLDRAGVTVGEVVTLEITALADEPDPEAPPDLLEALAAAPEARSVWKDTTNIARLDWIHWITTAKQAKTRAKRIADACDMLASGKRRVCCFDPSGFYSKAFKAPEAAE